MTLRCSSSLKIIFSKNTLHYDKSNLLYLWLSFPDMNQFDFFWEIYFVDRFTDAVETIYYLISD